jgi:Na+/proline symporter
VSLTDTVQAVFMIFALLGIPFLAITGYRGMGPVSPSWRL